jgi:hypothetical protein
VATRPGGIRLTALMTRDLNSVIVTQRPLPARLKPVVSG